MPTVAASASPGRCRTRSPTRRQTPRGGASASCGRYSTVCRTGQNPQRAVTASSAGSSVMPASRTHATPSAETGPRPFVEPAEESSSTSIAAITVAPLASSAGPERRSARSIATCLSSIWCSSSRARLTSSRQ